ncbi:hypothetical protein ACT4S5_13340 [Kocuria oceani]|uniref:hypothetical protein n=1 Tax=Kocuria oceani TaxID=988827 RepID=UPI004035EF23
MPAPAGSLAFRRFELEPGLSLTAHLAPGEVRCGIYVLHSADGSQYVEKSVDVVKRFAAHARHAGGMPGERIVRLDFAAVPPARLDACERETITRRGTGGVALRNKLLTGLPVGDSVLDETVGPVEQLAFLAGADEAGPADFTECVRAPRTDKPKPGAARLLARDDADTLLDVLGAYLIHAVPDPVKTEGRFWHLSAPMRSGAANERVLARLTVQNVETIFLVEHSQLGVYAALNLAPLPQLHSDYGLFADERGREILCRMSWGRVEASG